MWLCLTFCQILSLLFSVWEAVATPGEAQIAKTETFCDVNGETFKKLQKQIQQCHNKMDYYNHQNSTNWLQNLICLCRVSSIHSGRISATCRLNVLVFCISLVLQQGLPCLSFFMHVSRTSSICQPFLSSSSIFPVCDECPTCLPSPPVTFSGWGISVSTWASFIPLLM